MLRANANRISKLVLTSVAIILLATAGALTALWALPHEAAAAPTVAVSARVTEAPSDGTVKSHQKISATAGGFTGVVDASENLGVSTASIGDLDGDGVPDLAVGADGDNDGGFIRGAVWVLFMKPAGTGAATREIKETGTSRWWLERPSSTKRATGPSGR